LFDQFLAALRLTGQRLGQAREPGSVRGGTRRVLAHRSLEKTLKRAGTQFSKTDMTGFFACRTGICRNGTSSAGFSPPLVNPDDGGPTPTLCVGIGDAEACQHAPLDRLHVLGVARLLM